VEEGLLGVSRWRVRTTMANQNCIYEELRSRMKSGTAEYSSAQNLLSSPLVFKDI